MLLRLSLLLSAALVLLAGCSSSTSSSGLGGPSGSSGTSAGAGATETHFDAGAPAMADAPPYACPATCPPERPTCVKGRCVCIPTCHKGKPGCCGPDGCGGYVKCPNGQICLWPENRCVTPTPDCEDGWCRIPAASTWVDDPGYSVGHLVRKEDGTYHFEVDAVVWNRLPPGDFPDFVPPPGWCFQYPEFAIIVGYSYQITDSLITCEYAESRLGPLPSFCLNRLPSCPLARLSYTQAAWFANQFSLAEGLPPCYALSGCSGDPLTPAADSETPFHCQTVDFSGASCTGYRLPLWEEWFLAAQAGWRGPAWNVKKLDAEISPYSDNQPLAPYATYTRPSCTAYLGCGGLPCTWPPTKQRQPNPFGIYDILGLPEGVVGTSPIRSGDNTVYFSPSNARTSLTSFDFSMFFPLAFGSLMRPLRLVTWLTEKPKYVQWLPYYAGISFRLVRTLSNSTPCSRGCVSHFPEEPRFWRQALPVPPPDSYCYVPKLGWSLCCSSYWLDLTDWPKPLEDVGLDPSKIECDGDHVLNPDPYGALGSEQVPGEAVP